MINWIKNKWTSWRQSRNDRTSRLINEMFLYDPETSLSLQEFINSVKEDSPQIDEPS